MMRHYSVLLDKEKASMFQFYVNVKYSINRQKFTHAKELTC